MNDHVIVAGAPSGDQPGTKTEESQELGDGKAATGLLNALLREHFLIGRGVGHGETGAIDDADPVPTPEVSLQDAGLGILDQVAVNGFQAVDGQFGPGRTIRAGFIGRDGLIL